MRFLQCGGRLLSLIRLTACSDSSAHPPVSSAAPKQRQAQLELICAEATAALTLTAPVAARWRARLRRYHNGNLQAQRDAYRDRAAHAATLPMAAFRSTGMAGACMLRIGAGKIAQRGASSVSGPRLGCRQP